MSMDMCKQCDRFVDTDDDPDCYVERASYENTAMPVNPRGNVTPEYDCICQWCREGED